MFSICGVELLFEEEPDKGQIPFARKHRYEKSHPYGQIGTLKQYTGTDGYDIHLHLTLTKETMEAIRDEYDAQAADGERVGLFICPEPPYDVGVNVKITEFEPMWSENNRGLPSELWFDCDIRLEE